MRKLMILAVAAIFASNLCAQEAKAQKSECKKEKKECKMSQEERTNRDIKILSEKLELSEEQAAKFAVTYREFALAKAKLNKEYKAKFAEQLNERQVREVLHFQVRNAKVSSRMVKVRNTATGSKAVRNRRKSINANRQKSKRKRNKSEDGILKKAALAVFFVFLR